MPTRQDFVIFGIGRSGSTLLSSLLNSHPSIRADGEVFRPGRFRGWRRPLGVIARRQPESYVELRRLIAKRGRGVSVYGFKMHLQQVPNAGRMLEHLSAARWSIIYLERLSLFDQVISAIVAQRSRRYHGHAGQEEPDLPPLYIAPEQFLDGYRQRADRTQQCHKVLASLRHLRLVYELDLASPDRWDDTIGAVCEYIGAGLPPSGIDTHLRKPWSRPYSDVITNYGELAALASELGHDV